MRNYVAGFVISLILVFSGCSSLKEKTGDYIADAVAQKVNREVEAKLNERGLSIGELKRLADSNEDNDVELAEVRQTIKEMTKDYILLEGKSLVETTVKDYSTNLVKRSDLDDLTKEIWLALLGAIGTLVSSYLGKQVISAKKDGKRDERIAVLEKLLQKDIDGDGVIGASKVVVTKPDSDTSTNV